MAAAFQARTHPVQVKWGVQAFCCSSSHRNHRFTLIVPAKITCPSVNQDGSRIDGKSWVTDSLSVARDVAGGKETRTGMETFLRYIIFVLKYAF